MNGILIDAASGDLLVEHGRVVIGDTDSQIADLVTKGKTSLIKGFRSREGKPFDAYLTFDKDFRTVYGFPPRTDKPKGKERRR